MQKPFEQIPPGHHLEILYEDETANNCTDLSEALYLLAGAADGTLMGPHGNPTTPKEIILVDQNGKEVSKLRCHFTATLVQDVAE